MKYYLIGIVLFFCLLASLPLWPAEVEYFDSGEVYAGIVTCSEHTDYCPPSNAVGKLGFDLSIVTYGNLSVDFSAVHYSDITDNEWSHGLVHAYNTGDRGTELYGIQVKYKLW